MEDLFKEPILNVLFSERCEILSKNFMKNSTDAKKLLSNMENKLKKILNDEKVNKTMWDIMLYANYWNEYFYKCGIKDGMRLKNEIKEFEIVKDIWEFDTSNTISDHIEIDSEKQSKMRNDYKKIKKDIEDLKTKHPKIRAFLEEDKKEKLTDDELGILLKIIHLENDIKSIENEEIFKLGIKDGIKLLQ